MLFGTWWLLCYWDSVDRRMQIIILWVEPSKLTPVPAIWHCNQFHVISLFFCLLSLHILWQILNYIRFSNFYWLLPALRATVTGFFFFCSLFCKKIMFWIFINTNMNLETTCPLIHKGACTNTETKTPTSEL